MSFPRRRARTLAIVSAILLAVGLSHSFAYDIKDKVKAGENIKFTWTKDGNDFKPAWKLEATCTGANVLNPIVLAPNVDFDWNNLRPDLVGKACEFKFIAPDAATDWRQEIIGPKGKSTVYAGNIKKDSPWHFLTLTSLSGGPVRIPDLAPDDAGSPGLTIYTAVNLQLYANTNPAGFLNGVWSVGQSISSLGITVTNGEVAGLQGIQWATTPFVFDSDPAGPGFTPIGGAGTLLNSASFGHSIVILEEHDASPLVPATSRPGALVLAVLLLAMMAILPIWLRTRSAG